MFEVRMFSAGLMCISAMYMLTGCQSSMHAPDEKYYLVATNVKLPYWQAASNGLDASAAQLKIKAEMVGPATYDPKAEQEEMQRIIAKKPSGILISAADPEVLKGEINAAIAAGIPVVTMDSDAPGSQRLFFVGTNNYEAGLIGGKVLAKQLNGKGNVVVFTIPKQANLEERLHGYRDALAGFPEIKLSDIVDIHGSASTAFDKTGEILKSKSKVDGFVCLEATAGKEVADVLDRQKVTGKTVVAMDTDDGTLDWIEKGGIVATIAQRPYTMAFVGLKVLDDLYHHKLQPLNAEWAQNLRSPIPSVIDTGATLVDRSNLAEIRKLKQKMPAQ